MGALIGLIPTILALINNPALQQLLPLIQQILAQLGTQNFPNVDPTKAGNSGVALFNVMNTKWTQTALNILGTKVDVDGVYGQGTKDAVLAFQTAHGLVADGWAGEKTIAELQKAIMPK